MKEGNPRLVKLLICILGLSLIVCGSRNYGFTVPTTTPNSHSHPTSAPYPVSRVGETTLRLYVNE